MHNAAENKMKRGEKWQEWNLQLLSRQICVRF